MDQSVMVFAGTAARGSAIPSPTQGMYAHLNDTNALEYYDGSDWVNATSGTVGYKLLETVYFTSSGDFEKADYPALTAIKVKVVGGGGGGARAVATGAATVSAGDGGGGGGYAESFITDIPNLAGTVTVTVGSGGSGGSGSGGASAGGNSSFGTAVIGGGGALGTEIGASGTPAYNTSFAAGGTANTGDLSINGGPGSPGIRFTSNRSVGGDGGATQLAAITRGEGSSTSNSAGRNGSVFGSGGSGAANANNQSITNGGAGASGIVIIELYG
jgi:hypothetical protein